MKKIAVFWVICLFLSLFAGCSFSSSDVDISGGGSKKSFHKVCGSSSLKMDSSRNAFPSYQAENLFYYFYVKNSDGSTEKESFGAENSFSFSLENGEWNSSDLAGYIGIYIYLHQLYNNRQKF